MTRLRRQLRSVHYVAVLIALATVSCARAPRPAPPPAPETVEPTAPPAVDSGIAVIFNTPPLNYQLHSVTSVQPVEPATQPGSVDSVSIDALLEISYRSNGDGSTQLNGTVRRLVVRSTLAGEMSMDTLTAPVSLSWRADFTGISLPPPPANTECVDLEQTAHALLINFASAAVLPRHVTDSTSWTTSTQLASCRGGLNLQSNVTHHAAPTSFQSARADRRLLLQLDSRTELSGTGKLGASSVVIRGNGTGSSLTTIDLSQPAVQRVEWTSELQMEFDLGYRTDRLVQRVAGSISLLPPR